MIKTKYSLLLNAALLLNIAQPIFSKQTPNPNGSIKLFVAEKCPYCQKVIEYLKKIGQYPKVVILDVLTDAKNMTLLKTLTGGNDQRPYLFDEIKGIGMHESDDIIKYFSTRF
jgi:glutaredoxin